MTVEEMRQFYLELRDKVRHHIDSQFLGSKSGNPEILSASVRPVIQGALWNADLQDRLEIDFGISFEDNNIHFNLRPQGLLADLFVKAATQGTGSVDPDKKAGIRNFDPLWGSGDKPGFEHTEGVPPVKQNSPRWRVGYDPFFSEKG